MSEEELMAAGKKMSRWEQHRFMALIGGTILTAMFLVGVALALYASSGAAQLDLSRPGYKSVRNQAVRSDSFNGFPATGAITDQTLSDFRKMYDEQAKKATNFNSFGGGPMTDEALSIDDAPNTTVK